MTVLLLLSLALQSQSDSVQIAQLLDEARNTVNAINAIEKYERCIDMADRARLKYLKSTCKLEVAPLYISNSQSDKGLLTYFQLVNSLTEQRRFQELFTTYTALSTYYASRQMPKSAADYLKDALRLSDSVSLNADKPVLLYEIGKLELEALELDLALEYLDKADGIASQESRKNLLLKILRLKAKTYETLNRLDEAVRENERILELLEDSGDRVNYTNQLNNLGFIEQRRGNTSKALDYFLQTLEEREEMGLKDEEHIPLLMNVAITYQNSKESKAYLNRALQAAKKSKNTALQAEILDLLSVAYLNEDDFYNAQIYNQSGLELMDGSMPEVEMELNLTASVVYEKLLEYETALEYYKAYLEIKDSLDVAKRLSQEELAQQQLYLQRTEKQIQEVVDKGEIKDYQLQQLKLESENKDIQLKNQQLDAKQK
ncbi:MAG: hypothetical protein N4A46_08180, partial [Schleiferiaceae bacterium]|nr:hypothetical protein [Schleiferiaceae bacterium]